MSEEYAIEIEERRTGDGRDLYAVMVGFADRPQHTSDVDGHVATHKPAYSRSEAVEVAKEILDGYRETEWFRGGRPKPTADNTVLRDETGEFSMDEFFDRGTLAAYMGGTR